MFLQLYKAGLAYRAKLPCNFCPSCKTVLANEQVVDGKYERCDSQVIQKEIEQWLFKITAYAEELLNDLENLGWPETTKMMQKNWIGKSEGGEIVFEIKNKTSSIKKIEVFTTRTDTLFGATYLVLAPEHQIIEELKNEITNYQYIKQYIEESRKKTERERISEIKEKAGIELRGIKAINPVNNREIPIFVADYVLIQYGTGAIMAVPAHDRRDFDFAKKYNLSIIEVIEPEKKQVLLDKRVPLQISDRINEGAYEGEGFLINSDRFIGMRSLEAKESIGEWLGKRNQAKKKVYYRLRDWLISRQRYWGAPIPMIYCKNCASTGGSAQAGWIAVKEEDLPVLLPRIIDFKPTGEGESPLAKSKKFVKTTCPKCQGRARRETDTMDTFVCSSWYYLRYADPGNTQIFASKDKLKAWLPVNMYVGGAEHAVMHLLYSRFFTKVLKALGYLDFKEPFFSLHHQGIILGPDGQKMSKSHGNVIDPDEQVKKYGSDAIRMYLCFMGPYEQGGPWNPTGIVGIYRFLERVWKLFECLESSASANKLKDGARKEDEKLKRLIHKTIKKVTEDIENFRFNTAISSLMILVNQLSLKNEQLSENYLKVLLILLAPFTPHLAEELWQKYILQSLEFKTQNSIHNQSWPKYDPELIKEETITLIIQVNGKVRDRAEAEASISQKEAEKLTFLRENVKKWTAGKEIKRVIFVPGKLINIVV